MQKGATLEGMTIRSLPYNSLFQSEFFTQCDLVHSLSIASTLSFASGIQLLLTSSSSSSRRFYLEGTMFNKR